MAEAPIARKRAVPASRPKATPARAAATAPAKRPAPAPRRKPQVLLDDEPATPNFALRLTEGLEEDQPALAATPSQDTFALRLNEALEAINAANGLQRADAPTSDATSEPTEQPATKAGLGAWLAALDKLPPIRLPVGPAIPWRVGLPALAALVVVMGVMSRSAGTSEPTGVQLPAQQTYAVQQEAPLFAKPAADTSSASDADTTSTAAAPAAATAPAPATTTLAAQAQPIGVTEPAAIGGFDFMDVAIKLVAVLGLAYGSLMLLKRFGPGGAGLGSRSATAGPEVRVISSIALAPNRSVHVIEVPGGKTLLVGATPTAVNLLAELD